MPPVQSNHPLRQHNGPNPHDRRVLRWTIIGVLITSVIALGAWLYPDASNWFDDKPEVQGSKKAAAWQSEVLDKEFRLPIGAYVGDCSFGGVDFDSKASGEWKQRDWDDSGTPPVSGMDMSWGGCWSEADNADKVDVSLNNGAGGVANHKNSGSKVPEEDAQDAESCAKGAESDSGGTFTMLFDQNGEVISEQIEDVLCIHTQDRLARVRFDDFEVNGQETSDLVLRISTWTRE
ncbi:MAG: hypothetical protein ACRD0P_04835 [Stackebrandtia sp.]